MRLLLEAADGTRLDEWGDVEGSQKSKRNLAMFRRDKRKLAENLKTIEAHEQQGLKLILETNFGPRITEWDKVETWDNLELAENVIKAIEKAFKEGVSCKHHWGWREP